MHQLNPKNDASLLNFDLVDTGSKLFIEAQSLASPERFLCKSKLAGSGEPRLVFGGSRSSALMRSLMRWTRVRSSWKEEKVRERQKEIEKKRPNP